MRKLAWPIAALMVLAVAVPVVAADATYHGRITAARFWCGETEKYPHATTAGIWNLNLSGGTSVVTINVSYDKHDVSFGNNGGSGSTEPLPTTLDFPYGVATFDGTNFTWSADVGTCRPGHDYDRVEYSGVVGR